MCSPDDGKKEKKNRKDEKRKRNRKLSHCHIGPICQCKVKRKEKGAVK
jgi:hypothetical protein